MKNFLNEFPHLDKILNNFPDARTTSSGKIIYLDNAATNQRPKSVINAMDNFNQYYNANVHRGIHWMADYATEEMEKVRKSVAKFINAPSIRDIVFTSGTTHAINIVAHGLPGDVVVTELEHHANIVPWQIYNHKLNVIQINSDCELISIENQLDKVDKNSIVALTHISNVTGTINNIKEIIRLAHDRNLLVLIDGAQAIGHIAVDVQDLDCDFYCFSGHKMFGPMGIGILYGKEHLLDKMPPFMGGGEMIENVSFEQTTFNDLPYKFEAGTPNVSGIIGLGAAIEFINNVSKDEIKQHELELTNYAVNKLQEIGMHIVGPKQRGALVSWHCDIHPHDLSQILDQQGIAVRSGFHCAEPLHKRLGINGTTRASFSVFNTKDDIDELIAGINKAKEFFA